MTGQAHWLDFAIVFGGAFVVVGVLLALMVRRHLRRRRLRFTCPVIHEEVKCTITQNVDTGQWLSVERCSAFTPPTEVHCRQGCRDSLNTGEVVAR